VGAAAWVAAGWCDDGLPPLITAFAESGRDAGSDAESELDGDAELDGESAPGDGVDSDDGDEADVDPVPTESASLSAVSPDPDEVELSTGCGDDSEESGSDAAGSDWSDWSVGSDWSAGGLSGCPVIGASRPPIRSETDPVTEPRMPPSSGGVSAAAVDQAEPTSQAPTEIPMTAPHFSARRRRRCGGASSSRERDIAPPPCHGQRTRQMRRGCGASSKDVTRVLWCPIRSSLGSVAAVTQCHQRRGGRSAAPGRNRVLSVNGNHG